MPRVKTKAALGSDVRGMGYIYLITNTVNGKRYVGQTQREDIETRWKQHRRCDRNSLGGHIINAYIKHGIENFKFQLICICFDEACNELEIEYIKKFTTLAPHGYNLSEGGKNSRCHPETKKRISDANKGRIGKIPSNETKRKIALAHLGKKLPPHTKEAKEKISKGAIERYKRENASGIPHPWLFVKGQLSNRRKPVGKYDKEGNLLETYASTVEAGLAVGIGRTAIGAVCRNIKGQKTAAGFIWKFI